MLRIALVVLVVVVALLLVVSLLPQRSRALPDATIDLNSVRVALYPQADAQAVWTFDAPQVRYDPDSQETTLLRLSDGRREVRGETDFTLASDRIVIDGNDNLRGDHIQAHLVAEDVDLDMVAKGDREVLINQSTGRFEVPRVTVSGEDLGRSVFEDMRIGFDFTTFEAGGPGTVGYGEFKVRSPGEEQ